VDVKKENKKRKNIVKVNVLFIFFYRFFNDKITKNKEEFNILICSWLKIMNLHVSRISNIR
jgi:hypothetical protein